MDAKNKNLFNNNTKLHGDFVRLKYHDNYMIKLKYEKVWLLWDSHLHYL